jgi:hypothetical protein
MQTPVPPSPLFLGHFLEVIFCQRVKHSAIRPGSPGWYQTGVPSVSFLEIGRGHGVPNQGSTVGGDDSHFVFCQKLLGEDGSERQGIVVVKLPGLFSPKCGPTSSHIFTQLPQNVAAELRIHSLAYWGRCFALPQLPHRWRHQSGIFSIPPRVNLNLTWVL